MKKLILILLVLILGGCSFNKENQKQRPDLTPQLEVEYDDAYIETIPDNASYYLYNLSDEIILDSNEIANYNEEIKSKTTTIYDLDSITSISKEKILEYINSYTIPSLPKYNGNDAITSLMIDEILANRNIQKVESKDTIEKGIVVNRTNLKSFPTSYHFYDERKGNDFDRLQQSELHVNTPVLIIHKSSDNNWYLVISRNYVGWVLKDDIALASDEDISYFNSNSSFAIVTTPFLEIDGTLLDMSVKLPFIETVEDGYKLILPVMGDDNYVAKKEIVVSRDVAHIGYLPYTKKNIYIQSFKYENIIYSWGGMNKGVDCSSYVSNVFRTFGFEFPRNTSSQNSSVGKITYLNGKSNYEKLNIINDSYPALLYQPGHVMIYLGIKDNKHKIIHANVANMKVSVTDLEGSSNLANIDKLVIVN